MKLFERCFIVAVLASVFVVVVFKAPNEIQGLIQIVGAYVVGGATWSKIHFS